MLEWFRTRRRYIAFFILLCNAYTEMCARFGVSISMLGGMLKKDCNDPTDPGRFCWSENTQALVIGAYFYGYSAQVVPTFIAKRWTGFTNTYRFWMVVSGTLQFCYSTFAAVSPTLVVASQVVRGLVGGILMAYSFNYVAKFSVGNDSKVFIALIGATNYIGSGTGGLVAGVLTNWLGWEYYFFFSGGCYVVGLVLAILFVQEEVENCWYMTEEERKMVSRERMLRNSKNRDPSSGQAINDHKEGKLNSTARIMKGLSLYCPYYIVAFSVYLFAYNTIIYGILSVMPFYFNEITGASPLEISYLNTFLVLLIAVMTIAFTYIVQLADRHMTWLESRMLFMLLPMFTFVVFFVALAEHLSFIGCCVILTVLAITSSTMFSGSLFMVNYELDPARSPVRMAIFNSLGQVSGALVPLLKALITFTDPDTPDYDTVLRQRWGYFFYTIAGLAAVGGLGVVLAYYADPDYWVNRDKKDKIDDMA